MEDHWEQKPLGPPSEGSNPEAILGELAFDAPPPSVHLKSLLGLTLGTLSLSIHSLNPNCDPSFSLAGAALDQLNVPGLPFTASISCPRLDPEHVYIFVNGREHHDFKLLVSPTSSPPGSAISFTHGLNTTSLVGIIASDIDGYPFMSSFPLHFDDPSTTTPSSSSSSDPLAVFGSLADSPLSISEAPEPPPTAPSPPDSPSTISPKSLAACRAKNPHYPMLRPECQNPPLKQCTFYSSCVEASLPCAHSPASYAIKFGLNICRKFEHNLRLFSPRGNDFIWGTMHCLQRALVPAVADCAASGPDAPTCKSVHDAAFASHARCYVENGFCGLQCSDYLAELYTVGMDLFARDTARAIGHVAQGCFRNVSQIIEKGSCMGDGLKGIMRTAIRVMSGEGP